MSPAIKLLLFSATSLFFANTSHGQLLLKDSTCCAFPVSALAINPNPKYDNEIASSFGCHIRLWDFSNTAFLRMATLEGSRSDITSLHFSPSGELLASGGKDNSVRLWNLILRKQALVLNAHSDWVKSVQFNHNGTLLASAGKDGLVALWDPFTGKLLKKVNEGKIQVNSLAFSSNGLLLAFGSQDGTVRVWDIKQEKIHREYNAHEESVSSIVFQDSSMIISAGKDKKIVSYNVTAGNVEGSYVGHTAAVTGLAIINTVQDGKEMHTLASTSEDETIRIWNLSTRELLRVEKSAGGDNAIASAPYAISSGQPLTRNVSQGASPSGVVKEHRLQGLFVTGGDEKTMNFYRADQTGKLANIIQLPEGRSLLMTPDHYFFSSHVARPQIFFNEASEIPLQYQELKFNRPDTVLGRLGIQSEMAVAFKGAYKKRLIKTGVTPGALMRQSFPALQISDIPLTSETKTVSFTIKAEDRGSAIRYLLVGINGVLKKIDINSGRSAEKQVTLPLSNGRNRVTVVAVNELGLKSSKVEKDVFYSGTSEGSNLFVVSVGVSNYKDSTIRLKYAAKDARDVANTLKTQKGFKSVSVELLLDSLATIDNIRKSLEKLKNISVDDQVVFYFGGNGMLDSAFNYYLGTYDIDPRKPEKGGLPYDQLQAFLGDIPSRKKMVLMDACHSGEQESYNLVSAEPVSEAVRAGFGFRPAKIAISEAELMQTYFPLENSGENFELTSSKGNENSYENDTYKNGFFTYAFLSAVNDKTTDTNKDKDISFQELFDGVHAKVVEISGGKQHPTIRSAPDVQATVFRVPDNNDNTPPVISLIEPEKSRSDRISESTTATLKIKGVLNDPSGISSFKINGEIIQLNEANVFTREVFLKKGENIIVLEATDAFGNMATEKITVVNTSTEIQKLGKYHALVIGVADYSENKLDLDYPVADAEKLRSVLTKQYAFDSSNVTLMKNPTRSDIFAAFRKLKDQLNENDNLLIFYAGHGAMDTAADQGYWLPANATNDSPENWITNDDVKTFIKPLKAKHVLLITDACFSGKMFYKTRDISDETKVILSENNKMKSRRAITSGSKETVPDKSYFIEFLCDYLSSNKAEWFTSKNLYVEIQKRMLERKAMGQKPLDGKIDDTGDENGDFIFLKKQTPAP